MCDLHHAVYVQGNPADPQLSDVLLFPFLYFFRQLQKDSPPADPWATAPKINLATPVGHKLRRRITLPVGALAADVLSRAAQQLLVHSRTDARMPEPILVGAALEVTQHQHTKTRRWTVVEHVKVSWVPDGRDDALPPAYAPRLPGAGWLAVTVWHDITNRPSKDLLAAMVEGVNYGGGAPFADGWFAWECMHIVLREIAAVVDPDGASQVGVKHCMFA